LQFEPLNGDDTHGEAPERGQRGDRCPEGAAELSALDPVAEWVSCTAARVGSHVAVVTEAQCGTQFRREKKPVLRKLYPAAAFVLLAACASPVTSDNLRQANEGSATLNIDMPYEAAYRIIASEARRCYERTMPGATVIVRSDLYSDSKVGEVSVAAALMNTNITEIIFDIRATGPNASQVKAFYRKKSSESVANAMRAWLKGDSTVCHA
jgi:hypothetical protein